MLVYTRQKNIAQVFILERYFFDVYILASRTRLLETEKGDKSNVTKEKWI